MQERSSSSATSAAATSRLVSRDGSCACSCRTLKIRLRGADCDNNHPGRQFFWIAPRRRRHWRSRRREPQTCAGCLSSLSTLPERPRGSSVTSRRALLTSVSAHSQAICVAFAPLGLPHPPHAQTSPLPSAAVHTFPSLSRRREDSLEVHREELGI